jgi:hypothetical protein
MAYHMNKKAVRDAELIAEWRTHDDAQFAKVGISREQLEELLVDFLGEIILPWDPQYNAERRLYNPVFDPFPPAIFICKTRSDVQTIVKKLLSSNSYRSRSAPAAIVQRVSPPAAAF